MPKTPARFVFAGFAISALTLLAFVNHTLGQAKSDHNQQKEPKSGIILHYDLSKAGVDTSELMLQFGAGFEFDGQECPPTAGLIYVTKVGIRFAFPMSVTKHSTSVRRQSEDGAYVVSLESEMCRYELMITRQHRRDSQWVKSKMLHPNIDMDKILRQR